MDGFQLTSIALMGNSQAELDFKFKMIRNALASYIDSREGGFMYMPPNMKKNFLEIPQRTPARFADVKKGGGFEYVGAIMPIEKFTAAYHAGHEIAKRCETTYSLTARIIGRAHCMMFSCAYAFNRADQADVERAKHALHETNIAVLELGGIPWKSEEPAQALIMQKMDPITLQLMDKIKKLLDPNGIMNPGNWEVK